MRGLVVVDDCAAKWSFKDFSVIMTGAFWSYSEIVVMLLFLELAINYLRFQSVFTLVSHFNIPNLWLNVEVVAFLHPFAFAASIDLIGLLLALDFEYLNLGLAFNCPSSRLLVDNFPLWATLEVTVCINDFCLILMVCKLCANINWLINVVLVGC
jgi:hypothetical protein